MSNEVEMKFMLHKVDDYSQLYFWLMLEYMIESHCYFYEHILFIVKNISKHLSEHETYEKKLKFPFYLGIFKTFGGRSTPSKVLNRKALEAYSEAYQASKMECFAKIERLKAVNYFRKTLHLRCLTGFWIRLWAQRCSQDPHKSKMENFAAVLNCFAGTPTNI